MGFPPHVKEQALVACGRRCCLCHKFCGVRIECNHIIPEAEGGPNTFDNCIPLCFDCHAESGHYNSSHPKGNKITPSEQREHRDRFYSLVTNGVLKESFNPAIEQSLFVKLFRILKGSQHMLDYYGSFDYADSLPQGTHRPLYDFILVCRLPETEFLSIAMEAAFAELKAAITSFQVLEISNMMTLPDGREGIPRDWLKGPEQSVNIWHETRKEVNKAARDLYACYCRWVKEVRRTLHLDIDSISLEEPKKEARADY